MLNNSFSEKRKSLSTKEVADLLGISRIAVFQKIKKGQIKAEKVGRSYVIPIESLYVFSGKTLDTETKKKLSASVDKVMEDYGEAIKRLGYE